MKPLLDEKRLRELLGELDREIGGGQPVDILLVGGAALSLRWNYRGTGDVDFINDGLPAEFWRAVVAVGRRNRLPEDWMNDAAKINTPNPATLPPDEDLYYEGENIRVMVPCPEFLLATKLYSARERDIDDCIFLLLQTNITTEDDILDLLGRGYPLGVPPRCQYFALNILEQAGL